MEKQIIKTLKEFFEDENPTFKKKSEVTYYLAQIRKLIESTTQNNETQNTFDQQIIEVKFYADWLLHTTKERLTEDIFNYFQKIENEVFGKTELETSKKFIEHKGLKQGLKKLAQKYKFEDITNDEDLWNNFKKTLCICLKKQKINFQEHKKYRLKKIKHFTFETTLDNAVVWKLECIGKPQEITIVHMFE